MISLPKYSPLSPDYYCIYCFRKTIHTMIFPPLQLLLVVPRDSLEFTFFHLCFCPKVIKDVFCFGLAGFSKLHTDAVLSHQIPRKTFPFKKDRTLVFYLSKKENKSLRKEHRQVDTLWWKRRRIAALS